MSQAPHENSCVFMWEYVDMLVLTGAVVTGSWRIITQIIMTVRTVLPIYLSSRNEMQKSFDTYRTDPCSLQINNFCTNVQWGMLKSKTRNNKKWKKHQDISPKPSKLRNPKKQPNAAHSFSEPKQKLCQISLADIPESNTAEKKIGCSENRKRR